MAIIKASAYKFNDELTDPSVYPLTQAVKFKRTYWVDKKYTDEFAEIRVIADRNGYPELYYDDISACFAGYRWTTNWFGYDYHYIIVTEDTEVTDDFYAWFSANATVVPLIEAGAYRFNDKLTSPTWTSVYLPYVSYYLETEASSVGFAIEKNRLLCKCEPDSYSFYVYDYDYDKWNTGHDDYLEPFCVTQNTEVSEEFYNWFVENANAVELKIIKAGTYRWNDTLTRPSFLDENYAYMPIKMQCTSTLLEDNITYVGEFDGIEFEDRGNSQFFMTVHVVSVSPPVSTGWTPSGFVFAYTDDPDYDHGHIGWTRYFTGDFKTFIVTEDTEVSEDLYSWFTENTNPVIKAGNYRLKLNMSSPAVDISQPINFKARASWWFNQDDADRLNEDLIENNIECDLIVPGHYIVNSCFKGIELYTDSTDHRAIYDNISLWDVTPYNSGVANLPKTTYDGYYERLLDVTAISGDITVTEDTEVSIDFNEWFVSNLQETDIIKAGTYRWNDILSFETVDVLYEGDTNKAAIAQNIPFISNGETKDVMLVSASIDTLDAWMCYFYGGNDPKHLQEEEHCFPYTYDDGYGGHWTNEGLKTITILEDTEVSTRFSEFFKANTAALSSNGVIIEYNGSIIANPFRGLTATLICKDLKMRSDVVIEFVSPGEITYNGIQTAVLAGKTATLTCNGNVMKGNVEIVTRIPTAGLEYIISDDSLDIDTGDRHYLCVGRGTATDNDIVIASEIDGIPVKEIGSSAFSYCTDIKSVVIPYGMMIIFPRAFQNCYSLESVAIPNSVISLGVYAFSVTGLKNVVIGDGLTQIQEGAFDGCTALKDVYYRGTAEQWAEIEIGAKNDALTNATIHYDYKD